MFRTDRRLSASKRRWNRLDRGDDGKDERLEDPDIRREGVPPPSADGHSIGLELDSALSPRESRLLSWRTSCLAAIQSVLPDGKKALCAGRLIAPCRLRMGMDN